MVRNVLCISLFRSYSLFRVSCVRFSPNVTNAVIVSCGWDKYVKVRIWVMQNPLWVPGVMLHIIFATSEGFIPMRLNYITKISDRILLSEQLVERVLMRHSHQVWELSKFKLKTNHLGHTGYINTVSVSPDGSLAASGGKDGITMLWDLNEGKHLYSLEAGNIVNALVFSPNRYWLCAATSTCIKIFDLESKYVFFFALFVQCL